MYTLNFHIYFICRLFVVFSPRPDADMLVLDNYYGEASLPRGRSDHHVMIGEQSITSLCSMINKSDIYCENHVNFASKQIEITLIYNIRSVGHQSILQFFLFNKASISQITDVLINLYDIFNYM